MEGSGPPGVVIWTLRRTGGTSLERAFRPLVGEHRVLAEPFNWDRPLGDLTRAFRETGRREDVLLGLRARLARPVVIKHCVEMVSAAMNRTLLAYAALHDFAHVLLYRDREAGRLASLSVSLAFDIWGAGDAGWYEAQTRAGLFRPQPVDVTYLSANAAYAADQIAGMRRALLAMEVPFQEVTTETLYAADDGETAARLRAILRATGLESGRVTEPALRSIARTGNQRSGRLFDLIPNRDAVAAAIAANPAGDALGAHIRR